MDAEAQIEQANALHSIAALINEELERSGPEDWDSGILVLRSREDEEVDGWASVVWNADAEPGRMRLDLDTQPTLSAYRAATVAGAEQRWVTCLIEFHRSGKIRTRFEYEDLDRWSNGPDEPVQEYVARMRPQFDIPA